MHKQQGFTLIVVLTILVVLSLVVMSSFEQAQWVKRGAYYLWQQVTVQDRVWQQLIVAEAALPKRALRGQCFVPYSLANDYFFANSSAATDCIYNLPDQRIGVIYERIASNPCAQIRNNLGAGVDFFRITIHSLAPSSGQKTILQSIVALPFVDKKRAFSLDQNGNCTESKLYQLGRQSWLLH